MTPGTTVDDLPEGFTSRRPITFPCTRVRLVQAAKVVANDYNPNKVAGTEMDLLERSIVEDGVTQAPVGCYDPDLDRYIVVDGFHRRSVLVDRLGLDLIPVAPIDRPIKDRMASTIRHNRARGKHRVDLMGVLVEKLLALGRTDQQIAEALGMEAEEVLRLRQLRGIGAAQHEQEGHR